MKEILLNEIDNRFYIKEDFKPYLKQKRIRILNGSLGCFFFFPSHFIYEEFINRFEIPDTLICAVKEYSKGKRFVCYYKKTDPDLIIRGGLLAKEKGFLGAGIYCISEEDFTEEGIGDTNMRGYFSQRPMFGNTIIVFEYFGSYYKCVHGSKKEEIINIPLPAINEDNIVAIFDETISFLTEEIFV